MKVGEKMSDTVIMEAGTPQGSCLSPLLYIILVNDIPSVANCAKIGQFADDIRSGLMHKHLQSATLDSMKP